MNNYYKCRVLRVEQPLGAFFVASIPASKLLPVCFSNMAELSDHGAQLSGTQRRIKEEQLREIAGYISTKEAAFPNSIILGANFDPDGFYHEGDDIRWRIEEVGNGVYELIIPSDAKLASIIDGQHRLLAFRDVQMTQHDMDLLCSIYIDLPMPYHAYIFSTINFNQRKVDRSLAYLLFGFDIGSSDPASWVPETLAVSIARRLNKEETPFKGRIKMGVIQDTSPESFTVSMATVVDGILKLISKKPKIDRYNLAGFEKSVRTRNYLENDGSPLRELYLQQYDEALYEIITNFFRAVDELYWRDLAEGSFIIKTVGFQALFDVLYTLSFDFSENFQGRFLDFKSRLLKAADVDFTKAEASGKGRTMLRKAILEKIQAEA